MLPFRQPHQRTGRRLAANGPHAQLAENGHDVGHVFGPAGRHPRYPTACSPYPESDRRPNRPPRGWTNRGPFAVRLPAGSRRWWVSTAYRKRLGKPANPTATGKRRLGPTSGPSNCLITSARVSGVQGSLDEAVTTGPKGVDATRQTATSCSPRYSPTALRIAILVSIAFMVLRSGAKSVGELRFTPAKKVGGRTGSAAHYRSLQRAEVLTSSEPLRRPIPTG